MVYYVYILESCVTQKHYVGITENPQQRLKTHNAGRVVSTRHDKPWRIIYREQCPDRMTARNREKFLKSYHGAVEKHGIINKNK